ncbi:MAG: NAD(P)-dependent oxidoreductase [Bacteroidota bacterium]
MESKVIVFGGNGFLGTYLCRELLRRNYHVTIADIQEKENINEFDFVFCNILDREKVKSFLQNGSFDYVYNLAGFANLDQAVHFPYKTIQLNVIGNINILDGTVGTNCKRYIYASSTYAMSNKGSFYGISKMSSEKLIKEYKEQHNLNYTILRYGSVYSELPFENNYIYSLVEKAVKSKKIIHGGDGNEIREYIHASDAAKLSVDILSNDDFLNQNVILSGTEKMQRSELFQMIKEMMNNDIEITLNTGGYKHHYKYTPYSFPVIANKKLVANPHIDLEQCILACIVNINREKTVKKDNC